MTPEQQAVEDALKWIDAPQPASDMTALRHGRRLAAEVRRLRAENDELRRQMRGLLAADDIAVTFADEEETP